MGGADVQRRGRPPVTHIRQLQVPADQERAPAEAAMKDDHRRIDVGDMIGKLHDLLMPGRATSRNAIRLLEMMGYSEEIIKKADDQAAEFLKTGVWKE